MPGWIEIAPDVFVRRLPLLDQTFGLVVGRDAALLVDSGATMARGEELRRDAAQVARVPIAHVVNTHGHADHCFGNAAFPGALAWGHALLPAYLRRTAADQWEWLRETYPALTDELGAEPDAGEPGWTPRLPDRLVTDHAAIDLGGRVVTLRHPGRGHTDHDLVAVVADARVVFAGDLVENGAPPQFDDAHPSEWPGTVRSLIGLVSAEPGWLAVPGHGDPGGLEFVREQAALLEAVAQLSRAVHTGQMTAEEAIELLPFAGEFPDVAEAAVERGVAELRGQLMLD